jgi:hypothetical protein
MVATDHPGAVCDQEIDNMVGVRSEVHHIPGDDQGVYAKSSSIGEDSTQGSEVPVHIREHGDATLPLKCCHVDSHLLVWHARALLTEL